MLMILTPTHGRPCSQCASSGFYVAISLTDRGSVAELCPVHLASFLQQWMDSPDQAERGLPNKQPVQNEHFPSIH
jgi:hypothetical protein